MSCFIFIASDSSALGRFANRASNEKQIDKNCKCNDGEKWTGKKCVKKTDEEFCITVFDPVCGCDGKTYSNKCFAKLEGIKKYTEGECK